MTTAKNSKSSVLGDRLKKLRNNAGMSQQQLGDAIGVSRAAISLFELGSSNPSSETLSKLANLLDVDMAYLLGRNQVVVATHTDGAYRNRQLIGEPTKHGNSTHTPEEIVALAKAHGITPEQILAYVLPNETPTRPISRILISQFGGELILNVPIDGHREYISLAGTAQELDKLRNNQRADENTYRMFEVSGDSRVGALCEGEWVVGRYLVDLASIESGEVYVIVASDGLYIKRVTNAISKRGAIILHSDDPAYPTDVILAKDILEAWAFEVKLTSRV